MYATTNPRSDPSSIQILVTLTSDWLSLANDDRGLEPNDFSGHCVQNGEYRYSPVTKAILHALQRYIDRAVCANCGHTQRTATDRDKRLMRPFMTTKARRVQHAPTDETVSREGWVTRYLATHLKSADFSHVTHTFTRRETDVRGSRESSLKIRLYGQFFWLFP
jgi:hypothetical protein